MTTNSPDDETDLNGHSVASNVVEGHFEALARDVPPEYVKESRDGKFPVMEMFGPTLQGEGSVIGVRTVFIRFGGCDYRCSKCDSLHAIIPSMVHKHATWMTADEIFHKVVELCRGLPNEDKNICRWVTLSGGNPVMWDLSNLVNRFNANDFMLCLETQGSIWRDWVKNIDVVTISPKGPGMVPEFSEAKLERYINELSEAGSLPRTFIKVPVFSQMDLEFVASLDELLDFWGFPKFNRYLSMGNHNPPQVRPTYQMDTETPANFAGKLLGEMQEMWDMEIVNDWRLKDWRFLPQLHVLLWHNKAGV